MKIFQAGVIILTTVFMSCSGTKNTSFWVSGYKTEASMGAGKGEVLKIYKGTDLAQAKWENFYAPIRGFEFEEGFYQQIEVSETKLEASKVPADASSIEYTLVKVLEKKADDRLLLNGDWTLAVVNGQNVESQQNLPSISFDLGKSRISGTDGCNGFSGTIKNINVASVEFGPLAATQKMCIDMTIADAFKKALNTVSRYKYENEKLSLSNNEGKIVLEFMRKSNKPNQNLHDIWNAVRLEGGPINRMVEAPRLEINLTTNMAMGSDGCNNYSGKIAKISDSELEFGPLAGTRKMCRDMEVANRYNQALQKVKSYVIKETMLQLYDESGNEVLAFLKGD
jgi:heat shock protein HslJ